MVIESKPIPAFYAVYILRSTVRHASLYIGSTPNPPRRLAQHNGNARGGAARTSREPLRPWEMIGLVSGFPSSVAALKFEWALENPHLSMHIPSFSRMAFSTSKKANGHPRKPPKSLSSIISNLHLLLRVPSFARWPLKLHFFNPETYAAWQKWCSTVDEPVRHSLEVLVDFGSPKKGDEANPVIAGVGEVEENSNPQGIYALPLTYEPLKEYVAKGKNVFEFETEGDCVICQKPIIPGHGLHALCTNHGCEGVGHLTCWSRHMIPAVDEDTIIPIQGHCPQCRAEIQWGEMMKELTLRIRGEDQVEALLRKKRKCAAKP